ncbi:translational GTPase TypA [Campylobacter hyointestinalis]|uniref:Large ribosomal subunit assembly factor BipA n=1 Tax=Campylobacter hyointestinalis subsp. hyointestinalis TaxID=91352 RepID=A0A855N7T9_CAMHY|nr:translational GTPase TypA [Campylobacter hyointestinalis]PPB53500.1 translational GTPase TypA [Campylobacter hyointestinalis subsp. hyointestinalis]PPB54479.1 translational GTPase TypA [Campylobacter hyointestinalis subsp. hyointestinalis]PPB57843.1 translational GTPase TypA [Campylobacter hyointestinalis subsp. hyointestinalis]PPB61668.1 translational GTPase TypA [Campylobacter hyointestinalis subsp. hyointestinalis]PPB61973.1 translational GTPase TypA [Campylobacter hyointestinalis subsp.
MEKIRNIAVIAHVDHGKTTMVDELLKQSGTFTEHQAVGERVMDSNDIERERGITILSKNTAIRYKDHKINIIDTPGHADFGGEVERVLKMVDGVLLLVDAQEGVMPQTKFVVKKALSLGLRPIVVINKIDKPAADPDRVINEIFDLFVALDATDEQLEFPVVYAAAKNGYAKLKLDDENVDMKPLFETILAHVPEPSGKDDNPLQLQVFTLDYDNYVGKIGIARIFNGKISKNQNVMLAKADGTKTTGRISKLIGFFGLDRMDINEAGTGDIVAIAGFETLDVGDSVVDPNNPMPLDPLHIEEPTLSVVFSVNDSPLAGTEGKFVTSNKIDERLESEMKTNIAMKYENIGEGKFKVSGRGELQITILAENMRREGFEFCLGRPEVIIKVIDGVRCEPYELLVIDSPDDCTGTVIEKLGKRKAEMVSMNPTGDGQTRIEFEIPARGLIGFRSQFLTDTKGEGVMNHSFLEFRPLSGSVEHRSNGALVSMENGVALAYSLFNLQDRGVLFCDPQTKVYVGMIIGEHSRPNDLDVNPIKGKNLTNVRASGSDDAIKLVPPRKHSLERALEWIEEDELVEVTPINIRIRKRYLDPTMRKRMAKSKE